MSGRASGGGSGGRGRSGGYNNPSSQPHHSRGRGRGSGGLGGYDGDRAGYSSGGGGGGSDRARGGGYGGRPGGYASGSSGGGQGYGGGRREDYGGGAGGRREGYGGGGGGRREGYGGGGRREGYGGGGGGRRGESSSSSKPPKLPTLTADDWAEAGRSLSDDVAKRLALSAPAPQSSTEVGPSIRAAFGGQGRHCVVKANHFLVQLNYDGELHHYDVSIDPEVPSKKVCRDIMTVLVNSYKQSHLGNLAIAYDGSKAVYTNRKLPFDVKDFMVTLADSRPASSRRERKFKVVIKFANSVDVNLLKQFLAGHHLETPQDVIQILDVVLRSAKCSMDCTLVGRSLFSSSMGMGQLPGGLQFWKGFYQSVRPTQMGLSLNIDASARVFYEPILVSEYVFQNIRREQFMNRPLPDQERLKVRKALKGVTIETVHREPRKQYKVLGLSTDPSNRLMFSRGAERLSVSEYFDRTYKRLLYPYLPCVQVGSSKRPIYLPMEVCKIIEGQRYSKKLNDPQLLALATKTAVAPRERAGQVQQVVERNNYNIDELVRNFKLQVNGSLSSVAARVLHPPRLLYNGRQAEAIVDPSGGQWRMDKERFYEGGSVRYWACVNFSDMSLDDVKNSCGKLISTCNRRGMNVVPRPLLGVKWDQSQLEEALLEINTQCNAAIARTGERQHLQLLLIILPRSSNCYGKIKRICETELGIISQCLKPEKFYNPHAPYLENLALKINVKVGGRNAVLFDAVNRRIPLVSEEPTIIFGADVTHPAAGEDSGPSIAAVVASLDWPSLVKYKGLVSAQPHRQEVIQDLSAMVKELLSTFQRSNGTLPRRIIFYRDGVSEGQFQQVLSVEVDAIRKACQSLKHGYLPPVTFIVVQKRHHTRFFPEETSNLKLEKSGNILPGTVVDREVCHPSQYDFYLCSHAGNLGTSKPTHYHILFDENGFTADLIQLLTNSLCYTYARCARSISIVPSVFYAHLAAARARCYVDGEGVYETGSSSAGAGGGPVAAVRPLAEIKQNVMDLMFFC